MKKLFQKIGFASLVLFSSSLAAFAATRAGGAAMGNGFCDLIVRMHDVFVLLRTLAFVGAAFIIAGWAWGYITKPGDMKVEDLKNKGTGMLVGFILLFSIGAVLSFFLSTTGMGLLCSDVILSW